MKKIMKLCMVVACVMCMSITVFAATSVSCKVNNVTVTGKISYTDTSEYNPTTKDSVTAKTTAKAAMDTITAKATIYYATGSTLKTTTNSSSKKNATSCTVTSKASTIGTGYKGTGTHSASHNSKSGSVSTSVIW
ncbi:MAG: hypothetical protein IJP29_06245 [Lachnospiraceae bacterium]|nr:hypothetical protein [Lachnospiraceae bacterium]